MKIFLLEDENLAAQRLKEFLKKYQPEVEIMGWERSVTDGLKWLKNNPSPDLIFSDIELLDGNAFLLYEQFSPPCPIIFTTAYDHFLLKAFQTNGIAYLLKPFDYQQFSEAMEKYNRLFTPNSAPTLNTELITQLQASLVAQQQEYKQRFTIKKAKGIFLLKTKDIVYFKADGNLVLAFDNKGKKHPISNKLGDLEGLLDPKQFFRINRSEIVHLTFIEKMENYFNDRLAVNVLGVKDSLITSASKTASFRRWLG